MSAPSRLAALASAHGVATSTGIGRAAHNGVRRDDRCGSDRPGRRRLDAPGDRDRLRGPSGCGRGVASSPRASSPASRGPHGCRSTSCTGAPCGWRSRWRTVVSSRRVRSTTGSRRGLSTVARPERRRSSCPPICRSDGTVCARSSAKVRVIATATLRGDPAASGTAGRTGASGAPWGLMAQVYQLRSANSLWRRGPGGPRRPRDVGRRRPRGRLGARQSPASPPRRPP